MERFISARLGGTTFLSSVTCGPAPSADMSFAQACAMIFTAWRISSMRMQ